jgi:hypothetical protein
MGFNLLIQGGSQEWKLVHAFQTQVKKWKAKHTCDTFDDTWDGSDWLLSEKLDLVVQVRNPHGTLKDTTNVALYCHSPSKECPSKRNICKAQQPFWRIPLEANAPKLQWCSHISDEVVVLFIAVSRRMGSSCTVKTWCRGILKIRGLWGGGTEVWPPIFGISSPMGFAYHKAQGKGYQEPKHCRSPDIGSYEKWDGSYAKIPMRTVEGSYTYLQS